MYVFFMIRAHWHHVVFEKLVGVSYTLHLGASCPEFCVDTALCMLLLGLPWLVDIDAMLLSSMTKEVFEYRNTTAAVVLRIAERADVPKKPQPGFMWQPLARTAARTYCMAVNQGVNRCYPLSEIS